LVVLRLTFASMRRSFEARVGRVAMRGRGTNVARRTQLGKAVARVLPVLLLRPKALGADDQHAVLRQPPAGKPHQPPADSGRQARRTGDIDSTAVETLFTFCAEFERSMIRQRVRAGLSVVKAKIERDGKVVSKAGKVRKRLGRPGAEADKLDKARQELAKGTGIIKTAKLTGLGTGTVHKLRREMGTV
jgi:hypothetical protein